MILTKNTGIIRLICNFATTLNTYKQSKLCERAAAMTVPSTLSPHPAKGHTAYATDVSTAATLAQSAHPLKMHKTSLGQLDVTADVRT